MLKLKTLYAAFLFKAVVLNALVAVCHLGYEVFRGCCSHPSFHMSVFAQGRFRKLDAALHPWSYCAPRINCLDEHKGTSISYKSIYFLSCAEIIPERYLTAPEGPSEERQLEACCGNYSDSVELLPGLFLRGFSDVN